MGGNSLRMWQQYFPRALIHGIDITEKRHRYGPRVRTFQGDQNNSTFLQKFCHEMGPFDIVIDDGSHINADVKKSFDVLFPHLTSPGLYVIEDLEKSYMPSYGGDSGDLTNPETSISMVKLLVDAINYQEIPTSLHENLPETKHLVAAVHAYPNLAIIEKGRNRESSIIKYVHDSIR